MTARFRVAILGDTDRFVERVTREVLHRGAAVRAPLSWQNDGEAISSFALNVRAERILSSRDADQMRDELMHVVFALAPVLARRSHGLLLVRQPVGSARMRERLIAILEDASRAVTVELRRRHGIDFVLNLLDLGPNDGGRRLAAVIGRWLTGPHPYSADSIATSRRLVVDATATSRDVVIR